MFHIPVENVRMCVRARVCVKFSYHLLSLNFINDCILYHLALSYVTSLLIIVLIIVTYVKLNLSSFNDFSIFVSEGKISLSHIQEVILKTW